VPLAEECAGTVRQIKAARALLAWSQGDLAEASGISEPTVVRLESVDGPIGGRPDTGEKLWVALEKAGVEFIAENGGGAGVRLKQRTNKR
jgi:DNA-binding XRE family transcriptional regulator